MQNSKDKKILPLNPLMKEDSKAELGGVTGRGGPHETIADTQPKIFFGAEEDESPTDSNRPGTP